MSVPYNSHKHPHGFFCCQNGEYICIFHCLVLSVLSVYQEEEWRVKPARVSLLKRDRFQFNFKHKCLNHPYAVILYECQILEHFNTSLLPLSLFYGISDILLTFFVVVLTRGIKCTLWPNPRMFWTASLRDAYGDLIKRTVIEFNT